MSERCQEEIVAQSDNSPLGTPDDRKSSKVSHPGNALPFTFVNQHEDLKSVAERKIQSESQRHEIRSHVMRGVRKNEQAYGKKRPTGRPGRGKSTERSSSVTTRSSSNGEQARSPFTSVQEETSGVDVFAFAPSHSTVAATVSEFTSDVSSNVDSSSRGFGSLYLVPGSRLSTNAIQALLDYNFTTLLPMMFPVETKQPQQLLARKRMLLDYRSKRPVAFSAFMATTAAHRAIYYGHHKDLSPDNPNREDLLNDSDFKTAYSDAVRATRIKVQARETADSDFLDACFSLMSTASMIGNFEEAQAHLSAVKLALQTVELSTIAEEWLPLADNKTAIGLLTRPFVHLPWPRTHADARMLARVSPRPNTPMSRLATSFNSLGLSVPLLQIINNSRVTCHLCQLNDSTPEGLTHFEHEMYRRTSIEAEHDLLTYVYEIFPHNHSDPATLIVPALEQVIRLAVLGLYSAISIHILPASGLGRALTFHHKAALQRWCAETASTQPGTMELRAVAWALFVYMECAVGQIELGEFDVLLAHINADLGLRVWDEVEAMLYGFLYAPSMQRTRWKVVWEELQGKARGMLDEEDEENEGAWTRGGAG